MSTSTLQYPVPKRSAEEKAAQRANARNIRRAWIRHHHEVRAVACDVMDIAYKPIPVPATKVEQEVFGHFTEEHMPGDLAGIDEEKVRQNTPRSWEILTERN